MTSSNRWQADCGWVAYAKNGSVYYHADSWEAFGALSHLSKEEMLATANQRGNNPNDPTNASRSTLYYGKRSHRGNLHGRARGGQDGRAGILSVRACPANSWAIPSTSTVAVAIWRFSTTKRIAEPA